MKLSCSLLIAAQVLSALAAPAPSGAGRVAVVATSAATAVATTAATVVATTEAVDSTATTEEAVATTTEAGAGDEAGVDEGVADEIELQAEFGQVVELGGGNIKTDVLFPPGTNGVFEIEFQNLEGRQLRVTENPNPAPPPQGFVALEAVSYIVEIGGGAAATEGLTLQKIDYILNAGNTLDISQGQIARFCTEANAFVFGEGELEFEVEENELALTVSNMVGEFATFIPDPALAGVDAGAGVTGAGAELLDALQRLIAEGAAAPVVAAR